MTIGFRARMCCAFALMLSASHANDTNHYLALKPLTSPQARRALPRYGSALHAKSNTAEAPGSTLTAARKFLFSKPVELGVYLTLWYAFNAGFNVANKRLLDQFPHPWVVSWTQLATGMSQPCHMCILHWSIIGL